LPAGERDKNLGQLTVFGKISDALPAGIPDFSLSSGTAAPMRSLAGMTPAQQSSSSSIAPPLRIFARPLR
jgi:hypothetical protein